MHCVLALGGKTRPRTVNYIIIIIIIMIMIIMIIMIIIVAVARFLYFFIVCQVPITVPHNPVTMEGRA